LKQILKPENLQISVGAESDGLHQVETSLDTFLQKLSSFEEENKSLELSDQEQALYVFPERKQKNEGIQIPAQIQYVSRAGTFDTKKCNFGALHVVRQILSYDYLWNEVRVKGGAYGAFFRFHRSGIAGFSSYRDPNLKETLDIYQNTADYLRKYQADEREMLKSIIGTISALDVPLTPSLQVSRSLGLYLSHYSDEMLQKERDEILYCTVDDIHQIANVLDEILSDQAYCVMGNEQKLKDEATLFGEMWTLS